MVRKGLIDLTGDRYGRFVVIEEAERIVQGARSHRAWHVKCDCGTEKVVKQGNLRNGKVKSCGCIVSEMSQLEGQKFGQLTVVKKDGVRMIGSKKCNYWKCKCECGGESIVEQSALKTGSTKSCGCLVNHRARVRNLDYKRHGLSKHPLYGVWLGMLGRCENKNDQRYHDYGGRGLYVCKEWNDSPVEFIRWAEEDAGWIPKSGLSLDRIDVNGNYEPNNCRFANNNVQALNRRSNTNNSSGYHGVSKRSNGRWRARITFNGKINNIGTYDEIEDAVEARQLAEIEILGYLADSQPINDTVKSFLETHQNNIRERL